jgi:hypothetical protein
MEDVRPSRGEEVVEDCEMDIGMSMGNWRQESELQCLHVESSPYQKPLGRNATNARRIALLRATHRGSRVPIAQQVKFQFG